MSDNAINPQLAFPVTVTIMLLMIKLPSSNALIDACSHSQRLQRGSGEKASGLDPELDKPPYALRCEASQDLLHPATADS